MGSNKICLLCREADKRRDFQFCSQECTDFAAEFGPFLLPIPDDHVLFENAEYQFYEHWEEDDELPPVIARIFLITWSDSMRTSFEEYKDEIAFTRDLPWNRAEVKRFRAETRACNLGDPGCDNFCSLPDGKCRLCTTIRTGFEYSLDNKRLAVLRGAGCGVRFGGGLYLAPSSSKAYQYAKNNHNGSRYKAVIMARVVLGNPEYMFEEDHDKLEPSPGYDSVETCIPGQPKELVVFHEDAARPAYLIMLE